MSRSLIPSSPLSSLDLESLEPDAFASMASFDKVWVVRIARSDAGSGLVFTGREYDTATRRLGPLQRHGRAHLSMHLGPCSSSAAICSIRPRDHRARRGACSLDRAGGHDRAGEPARRGRREGNGLSTVAVGIAPDGKVQIVRITHTYLQVESVEGPVARCAIISALADPLTKRMARPNSLAAVGLKPGNSPITLRFVTRPDQAPAAGYTLTARLVPDGQPRELGMTDRAGTDRAQAGFCQRAGHSASAGRQRGADGGVADDAGRKRRRNARSPFDPKPLTVALETQLDSLRDEVVDLVALRARLESRMKARLEGEDWAGLEAGTQGILTADPARSVRPAAHAAQGRCRPPPGRTQEGRS